MATQALQRDLGECVRSRRVAEAHFVYECSNDADTILESMKSYDPLLTSVVVGESDGAPRLVRCATVAEQRQFYATGRARSHMVGVDIFTSIGSDWYGFVHGIVKNRVLETSEEFSTEILGLLPSTADEDTIAGEVGLGWPSFAKRGDAPGALAQERVATMRAHEAWLDAFRRRDLQALAERYAGSAAFAMRHPVTGEITAVNGREPIVDWYRQLFAELELLGVEVVLRVVDRWYAFSELLLRLRDRAGNGLVGRIAEICVVRDDDKIMAHLGSAAEVAST